MIGCTIVECIKSRIKNALLFKSWRDISSSLILTLMQMRCIKCEEMSIFVQNIMFLIRSLWKKNWNTI
jgi:hypothetical protein